MMRSTTHQSMSTAPARFLPARSRETVGHLEMGRTWRLLDLDAILSTIDLSGLTKLYVDRFHRLDACHNLKVACVNRVRAIKVGNNLAVADSSQPVSQVSTSPWYQNPTACCCLATHSFQVSQSVRTI
jgi:hypothetical protein